MYNEDSFKLKDVYDIQNSFEETLGSLGLGEFEVSLKGDTWPLSAALHPYVSLPRLAHRAEELALSLFGFRLFSDVVYVANNSRVAGIEIVLARHLSDEQRRDPVIASMLETKVGDLEVLTKGLRGLVMEVAVTDVFEIDHENSLLIEKAPNWRVHTLFKTTPEWENDSGFPLLTGGHLGLSELLGWASEDDIINALNKARRAAEELLQQPRNSRDDEYSQGF